MMIADLLQQIGHPLGRRGRTTCPIHQGGNDQTFWFNDHGWTCFAGCGGGGIRQLQRALGIDDTVLAPTYRIEGLDGILGSVLVVGPTVTDLLTRRVLEDREVWDRWAALWHRHGLRLLAWIEAITPLARPFPWLWDDLSAYCGVVWEEAQMALGKAHRFYGAWPYPCGCYQ